MFYVAALVAIALIVAVAWQVDDWRRDLVCHAAQTAPDSSDARLRPLFVPLAPADALQLVRTAATGLAGWRLVGASNDADRISVNLERTTRLLRFTDDVTLRLVGVAGGTEISARSESRIGKGDLGQNPRNIHELFTALKARLGA